MAAVYSLYRLQITVRLELLPTQLYLGWYNDCLLQAAGEAAHACTCRCEMRPVNILFVQGYLFFFFFSWSVWNRCLSNFFYFFFEFCFFGSDSKKWNKKYYLNLKAFFVNTCINLWIYIVVRSYSISSIKHFDHCQ